jgi:hypothetical protein
MAYAKLPDEDDSGSTEALTRETRSNIGFAKAAIVLTNQLADIRGRSSDFHLPYTSTAASQRSVDTNAILSRDVQIRLDSNSRWKHRFKAETIDKAIRILGATQGAVTGLLSLAVAILQLTTYRHYLATKDDPNMWPPAPNLTPTLMLLGVAVAAFIIDAALLITYLSHREPMTDRGVSIMTQLKYLLPAVKSIAFALAVISCIQNGQPSGNSNLWKWSCSDKAGDSNTGNCKIQVSRDSIPCHAEPLLPRCRGSAASLSAYLSRIAIPANRSSPSIDCFMVALCSRCYCRSHRDSCYFTDGIWEAPC